MSRTVRMGEQLVCDVGVLVDTRLLLQANSGGGKSWALRRLLEQTHGQVQHLVLDPEGEFATLRERFDYVVAARQGGDTPADPRSAKLLAEKLLELGASAIIDLYELKAHERVRFVGSFLEALINAPKALWHPALVVVDEAHVFCPEQGDAESAGAVIDLATRGRKRGFCAVLATQRISKLRKDAAAELNNKLIGRSALDVDMRRAGDELGFTTREQRQDLRELDPGEFFAFGPAFAGKGVLRGRVGPVQTSHPKAGARLTAPTPAPTERIRALLPKLADLPAEAEQRARTEAELKKELAETRRQLTVALKAQPVPPAPKVEVKEIPVLKDGQLARIEKLVERFDGLGDRLVSAGTELGVAARELQTAVRATRAPAPTLAGNRPQLPPRRPVAKIPVQASPPMPRSQNPATDVGTDLTGPEQRILDAIAWLEAIGVAEPEQPAVAFLAGYTWGGGAFNNPRGRLNQRGLVRYINASRIALTDAGRALASVPDAPLTTDELHRRVLDRLPGPEQRLLRPLLEAYPDSLSNGELAERAGYTPNAGAFNNPRGRLRSLGLIDYPEPGRVTALPLLFLERA